MNKIKLLKLASLLLLVGFVSISCDDDEDTMDSPQTKTQQPADNKDGGGGGSY